MANPKTWLVATNLHYQRPDGSPLFSGLELTLDPGITALIGENGVGKSTLAALLAGALPTHSGASVQRFGRTPAHRPCALPATLFRMRE